MIKQNSPENASNPSRRSFLSKCGRLSYTAVAVSSLPMAGMLSACDPNSQYYRVTYNNWEDGIIIRNILAVKPATEKDLLDVINYAQLNGYSFRAFGKMHTWCPITIAANATKHDKIILADLSQFKSMEMLEQTVDHALIKVGAGQSLEAMHKFLAEQKTVCEKGYGFSNVPAPGELSIGGALAIGCHGTAVPYTGSKEAATLFGSLSNRIISLKAAVWNAASKKYELKTFQRNDPEIAPFLVNLGRTVIVEFVLQASPSFNMRCVSFFDQSIDEVLAPNQSDSTWTISNILDNWGRCEIIWFPYTDKPWMKVWQVEDEQPFGSKATKGPFNYGFSDNLPRFVSDSMKLFFYNHPHHLEGFGPFTYSSSKLGCGGGLNTKSLDADLVQSGVKNQELFDFLEPSCAITTESVSDIWGPAWHTMLYVKGTTLRMHANGYAVRVPRHEVQTMLHRFKNFYRDLLETYRQRGEYPTSGPLEVRFNGLDYTDDLVVPNAVKPTFSALTPSQQDSKNDIAIWLDVLTFNNTRNNWKFLTEIEEWLYANYGGTTRGEWSKGWSYTNSGPWTNDTFFSNLPNSFTGCDSTYEQGITILDKYDPHRLFASPVHEKIFPRQS